MDRLLSPHRGMIAGKPWSAHLNRKEHWRWPTLRALTHVQSTLPSPTRS